MIVVSAKLPLLATACSVACASEHFSPDEHFSQRQKKECAVFSSENGVRDAHDWQRHSV